MADDSPGDGGAPYCYCYCIVDASRSPALDGLGAVPGGLPPRTVRVGGLRAVVSSVLAAEFHEEALRANLRRMNWVEAAALAHEQVVEGCLRQAEVVPLKFCTLFRSESDLAATLLDLQEDLASRLADLAGKQEWGIRLTADPDGLRGQLLSDDLELTNLRNGVTSKPAGMAYLLRKRMEDRVAHLMDESRSDVAEAAYARLAGVATKAALLGAAGSASNDGLPVLNAAFLVTEEQLAGLLDLAEQMVVEWPWLRCQPTGPWPPYNFV